MIVFPEEAPIEVQVRTEWQHEWAEFFEKLADRIGRGIRYGEPPERWWIPDDGRSSNVRKFNEAEYKLRTVTVAMALIVAGMIDAVEAGEFVDRQNPEQPRREVDKALDDLQQSLHDLADVSRQG